jgi:hypothetical protein
MMHYIYGHTKHVPNEWHLYYEHECLQLKNN